MLKTPPPDAGILEGATPGAIIELAHAEGIAVQETALTRHDVYAADECFLTGTAAEVISVVKVRRGLDRTDKPRPDRKQLRRRFHQLTGNSRLALRS